MTLSIVGAGRVGRALGAAFIERGYHWRQRILVDVTNPISPGMDGLLLGTTRSGAEQIAQAAPTARGVKAFNTTGFENLRHAQTANGRHLVMPVAGDDEAERRRGMALATAIGFEPLDSGELRSARYLEPMAMLWMKIALRMGRGRRFGFAIERLA